MPSMPPVSPAWTARMVEEMRGLRAAGVRDFDEAWRRAIAVHPARSRDDYTPMLFDEPQDVGSSTISGRNTVVGFFRAACRDAWYGARPALRHFTVEALRPDVDASLPAGRQRAA